MTSIARYFGNAELFVLMRAVRCHVELVFHNRADLVQEELFEIVWRPLASWIAPPTVWRMRPLQLSRERQCRLEPLPLDDRTGCHRLDLLEHPERQRDTFVSDSKALVQVIDPSTFLPASPRATSVRSSKSIIQS